MTLEGVALEGLPLEEALALLEGQETEVCAADIVREQARQRVVRAHCEGGKWRLETAFFRDAVREEE